MSRHSGTISSSNKSNSKGSLALTVTAAAGTAAIALAACLVWQWIEKSKRETPEDKVILVTGCDSGFGKLVAQKAVEAGFTVVAACYRDEGAAALENEVTIAEKDRLTTVVADLTTNEGCQVVAQAAKIASDSMGGLYALVNNAGICIPARIDWANPQTYEDTLKVNFYPAVNLTYELIPLLKKKKGRVINVTSVDGIVPMPGCAAYSASKAALESYSDVLRCEMLQWGVKVVVVEPSTMKTPLVLRFAEEYKKNFDQAPEDRKIEYGNEYAERVHQGLVKLLPEIAADPNETANDIINALLLCDPPTRVLSGAAAKVLFKPLSLLPDKLRDKALLRLARAEIPPLGLHIRYPPVNQIAFVTIRVSNLKRSVAFYEIIGYTKIHEQLDGQQFMKAGNFSRWKPLLLLVEDTSMTTPRAGGCYSIGMTRLCHLTSSLQTEIDRMKTLGLEPAYPIAQSNWASIVSYSDPDDFVVYSIQFGRISGLIVKAMMHFLHASSPQPFHWTINVKNGSNAKQIFERLGFITFTDQNRYNVDEGLLPAFGLKGFPMTIIEHIRLAYLPQDDFYVTIMEWTKPESVMAGQERLNSFAISVMDVHKALEHAKEAGMIVEDEVIKRKLPYFGEVRIATAYVEEGSNRVEFVSF